MRLKDIYKSDVYRDINGVIKVGQRDEEIVKQELTEYVVTKELNKQFSLFLSSYANTANTSAHKNGVWISGFFGSGKSHFLKILSYILSGCTAGGKAAVEYFSDKFEDSSIYEKIKQCTAVPAETILFNMDAKGPSNKDKSAIRRIFAKVFYEHLGYCGDSIKTAKLEQHIERVGKKEEFIKKFLVINKIEWEKARVNHTLYEDGMVTVLKDVLGMSETAARNWFLSSEEEISIEQLAEEIKEYAESKGKGFRLIFMADEVGQYIGGDSDLMLNLQTLTEEIGIRCGNKVWIIVTSQESIDSAAESDRYDFSKIQGRFAVRLNLTSASVDEVIKKRILAKTNRAEELLCEQYRRNSTILKNIFTFANSMSAARGYSDCEEFTETYPFVPYQFALMQNALFQISRHSDFGKHLAGGERTMLSAFREAAAAAAEKDENYLVPFWAFYDTISASLDASVRNIFERAEKDEYLNLHDLRVLKLLYLIRYTDKVKASADNIAVLMTESIQEDKIKLQNCVKESLGRLLYKNYIARSADVFVFLTEEEQIIENDIRFMPIDSEAVAGEIARVIFENLYTSRAVKLANREFSYNRTADGKTIGRCNESAGLHIITAASHLYDADEQELIMRSAENNEAIVVLAEGCPYYEELESALKINKYIKSRSIHKLPEKASEMLREKQQQAILHEKRAAEYIADSIVGAKLYVAGEKAVIRKSGAKARLDAVLEKLIKRVYSKLGYISYNFEKEEIRDVLSGKEKANKEAIAEIEQYLEMQSMKSIPVSMGELLRRFSGIPYGWRGPDIAAAAATLALDKRAELFYCGVPLDLSKAETAEYLVGTESEKTTVIKRTAIPSSLIKKARGVLKEYFNTMDIPNDEHELVYFSVEKLEREQNDLKKLLNKEYAAEKYPGKSVLTKGIKLCGEVLKLKADGAAFLAKIAELDDELLDFADDMSEIYSFFRSQRPIFDSAEALLTSLSSEKGYFAKESELLQAIEQTEEILSLERPYGKISSIPMLIRKIKDIYDRILKEKKDEVLSEIINAAEKISKICRAMGVPEDKKRAAAFNEKENALRCAQSLVIADAISAQTAHLYSDTVKEMLEKIVISGEVFGFARLECSEDIENYLSDIRGKLTAMLKEHGVFNIV